ncbi:10237_t:CDS:1, partial [Gigaspora margarita]
DIIRRCKWKNIKPEILKEVKRLYKVNKNDYNYFRDGNFCLESELLDLDTAKKLITWISGKQYHEYWYKFELLFNTKHNGFKSETFHKKCDGKGSTIVIIELYDNDNLIGGYNPLDWKSKNVWKKTKNSFLFRKRGALDGHICKKFNIKNGFEKKAIGCRNLNGPMFGATNLYISSNYCNVKGSHYESVKLPNEYLMKSYEVLRVIKQR